MGRMLLRPELKLPRREEKVDDSGGGEEGQSGSVLMVEVGDPREVSVVKAERGKVEVEVEAAAARERPE